MALCQCLAFASIPLALGADAYAFYHGGRKLLAWIAWLLLTAQLSFVAIGIAVNVPGMGWPAPAIDVFVVGSLAWWGIANRHRRPSGSNAEGPRQWIEAPIPAARAVTPEEVVGTWRFYVDAASSMVALELRADGTFRQSLLDNRGERSECQGGAWRLDGPWLDLDGYRDVHGMLQQARWFFADSGDGLSLFVSGDPTTGDPPLQAMKTASDVPAGRQAADLPGRVPD